MVLAAAVAYLPVGVASVHAHWPQWGGPNRNFTVETSGLADKWPEDGPPRLWRRTLGDGYSAIVADGDLLFTMYRSGRSEFTVALDAKTGNKIWKHRVSSHYSPNSEADRLCPGPSSTPALDSNRLFSIGTDSLMHCFDKTTGKVLWKHDLTKEFNGRMTHWGYTSSPLVYQDMVIAVVGRLRRTDLLQEQWGKTSEEEKDERYQEGRGAPALVAFDQVSGDVRWEGPSLDVDHSSPILINFQGTTHLVLLHHFGIIGLNPDSGEPLWHYEIENTLDEPHSPNTFDMTPVWVGNDVLITSGFAACRAMQLTNTHGVIEAKELWRSRKIGFGQTTPVCVGNHLFGSNDRILAGVDIKTGRRSWVRRGFSKAMCVHGDGRLIILDSSGQLSLVTVTPEDLTVHSQCKITEPPSFTAPTLVGTTLYVRDRKHILALDLGVSNGGR